MNLKSTVQRIFAISMLVTILIVVQAGASPDRGAHVDEHWFQIIIDNDSYVAALLTHDMDMGGPPTESHRIQLMNEGFTMTETTRLGYTFLMENNRVWPFGTTNGNPADANYDKALNFRRGCNRLVPKADCVAIYGALMSACEWYLPPGSAYWINPEEPAPAYDPMAAIAYLDAGGFVQGTTPNPDYDDTLPWSAEYMRIDPVEGGDVTFEYYAIGPVESPLGFEMAELIASQYRIAGLGCDLVAGTWLGMVIRLTNSVLDDYEMMTGVGITWGSPAPDILYDFTYSQNLPLWNFAVMDIPVLDAAGELMMSTLDLDECRQAAFDIQEYLNDYEPYMPMLLWNMFIATTPPYEGSEGGIGIVNFEGQGAASSGNLWGKMLTRCDRYEAGTPINKWGLGAYLDTLNPLMADTVPDWQVLTGLFEGHYYRNPYALNYMWFGAEDQPVIEPWVGPGRSQEGGDGVYNAPYNGTHYNGIPVGEVTTADMQGDDVPGMVTTWTLRSGQYWHDSDPGADLLWDTTDDGTKHPVTAEDARFGLDLLKYQENARYVSNWWFIHAVEVTGTYEYKVYEERRYLFGFEAHDVGLLTPKHIWEPYINPTINTGAITLTRPDGSTGSANIWTGWDESHETWEGWEDYYMDDPITGQPLTYLIGNGPFVYHLGGWEPGVSAHFESNKAYFGRHVCPGDIDFDQKVEDDDWHTTMASFGEYGDPNYLVRADICYPAQRVDLDEVYAVQYDHFGHYWGPDPVPPGFIECP